MTWLDLILRHTHQRITALLELGDSYWQERIKNAPKVPSWDTLPKNPNSPAIIAEYKPASPSRGRFPSYRSLEDSVREYTRGGACSLSILTEPSGFCGHMDLLYRAFQVTHLPLLCKDFILHPIQVLHARASGASAVLLIHGLLSTNSIQNLLHTAKSVGLEVLYEVFTLDEARSAIDHGATWIGLNNRDLKTMELDKDRALRIFHEIPWPPSVRVVAESGFSAPCEVHRYFTYGIRYFLIGSGLMESQNPQALLHTLHNIPGSNPSP